MKPVQEAQVLYFVNFLGLFTFKRGILYLFGLREGFSINLNFSGMIDHNIVD